MAMEPKIEPSPIEREIHQLSEEIKEKNYPEEGREAVHRAIGEKLYPEGQPSGATTPLRPSAPERPPAPNLANPLPTYAQALPKEATRRAEELLALAFQAGILKAVNEVRKEDPLTMNIFHGAITDKLYGEFQRRGLMK